MASMSVKRRCPGMSFRSWGVDDIYEIACPHCDEQIEFFSIDKGQHCPGCLRWITNPRGRATCSEWCTASGDCPGASSPGNNSS